MNYPSYLLTIIIKMDNYYIFKFLNYKNIIEFLFMISKTVFILLARITTKS